LESDKLLEVEPDWVNLGETADGIPVNRYFANNPHMLLGTMSIENGHRMYGAADSTTCMPIPGADLAEQLDRAVANIKGQITQIDLDDVGEIVDESIPADYNVRNFSYTIQIIVIA
jgi:N12 class adenine-specific DNA methylase